MADLNQITVHQLIEQWQKDQRNLINESLRLHKEGQPISAAHIDGRIEELTSCITELTRVIERYSI